MEKTIDGIKFNSIKTDGVNYDQWPLILTGRQGPDEDGGIVNAVDIDWNGAVLPNSNTTFGTSITINTTGELLNLIDSMQKEIYTLSAAVIALAQTINSQMS